ncbi:MAG: FAD-dependent oxidoreductase [Celeribacter marinus]
MKSSVVIIGAGQAGAAAAIKLRSYGHEGAITLLGNERHAPYERPELSKAYALGAVDFAKLIMLTPDKAKELAIDMRLDTRVTAVNRDKREVQTVDGPFAYDHLIFATGGAARRIPLPDALIRKGHTLRIREDADHLGAALKTAKTAAVIGGGWLGLEAAATCRKAGLEVHVYEAAPRLCARVAPPWLSDVLSDMHLAQGVTLHMGAMPDIRQDGTIYSEGSTLTPDVVITAIGMIAHDTLAQEAGLACDDGIIVAQKGETSDKAIFAIGDCARYPHLGNLRRESWQNANQSADDVARLLTGQEARPIEADWFWSNQFEHNIQMLGQCHDGDEAVIRINIQEGSQSCFFLQDGCLKGCISINAPRDIGMSRAMITKGQKMDLAKLADPAIPVRGCIA